MSAKQFVVAVVGAPGAVGREMLKTLEQRNFPASKVIPLASSRSAGSSMSAAVAVQTRATRTCLVG